MDGPNLKCLSFRSVKLGGFDGDDSLVSLDLFLVELLLVFHPFLVSVSSPTFRCFRCSLESI